jgi:hypothetical protein
MSMVIYLANFIGELRPASFLAIFFSNINAPNMTSSGWLLAPYMTYSHWLLLFSVTCSDWCVSPYMTCSGWFLVSSMTHSDL